MIAEGKDLVFDSGSEWAEQEIENAANANIRTKILNRKKDNQELISILTDLMKLDDDLRFGQVLEVMFIKDPNKFYYEEPADTLAYVKEQLKKIKK